MEIYERSIEPLSKAILLSKYEPCYIHERAKSYLLVGEFQKSVDDFTRVIELQPKNPHAYFGRGFAWKALKKYESASEDFEKAKELDPNNPKLVVNYKMIYNVKYIKLCEPGEELK